MPRRRPPRLSWEPPAAGQPSRGHLAFVRYREARQISQYELARELGIHQSSVAALCLFACGPSLALAFAIEELAGIPPRWWLEPPDATPQPPPPAGRQAARRR